MPLFLYGYDWLGSLKKFEEQHTEAGWSLYSRKNLNNNIACTIAWGDDPYRRGCVRMAPTVEEAVWLVLKEYKEVCNNG